MDADALDVSAIEDLDPSLVDGATIIYDREVSILCLYSKKFIDVEST